MEYKSHHRLLQLPALALSLILTIGVSAPAHALQFKSETGEVITNFDTTITVGGSWRMQDQDSALIGITNGGRSRSVNEDDGNLNYDRGDLVSLMAKVTHDFQVKYESYGLFLRGTYFYDHTAADKKAELGPRAEDRLIKEADLLDAYVWAGFDIAGRKLNLRGGRQVVSWGESTFIPNGINIINPVDVAKFRAPGAELKEALLPTPIAWLSQELSTNTSIEAVYLTNWEKTRIDPRGSFFSTNDYLSDDGDKVYIGFGRRVDQHFPPGVFNPVAGGIDAAWAPRSPDRTPDDSGQYGFALRQLAPNLNNTEFGFFFMNYHSRTPFASGVRGGVTVAANSFAPAPIPVCPTNIINIPAIGTPGYCTTTAATYFAEYPEDIKLYGASFNTSGPAGIALQGEYSYRPNQPVQLAAIELVLAALGLQNNITGDAVSARDYPLGKEISGYREVRMHQAQVTGTKAYGPTIGAEQFTLVGEVGYTYLDLPDGLLFSGPGTHLPAPGSSVSGSNGSSQPNGQGYATKSSWGYRLLGRMDFDNAIGPATLSPRIAYAQDVQGVSPTFNEGVKAATIGLGYNLRQVWQADIAYTTYWGGRTYSGTDTAGMAPYIALGQSADYASSANQLKDRDFISASVSYSF